MNVNNNNFYVSHIRNLLTAKYPNIILLWAPGHCNIKGNEFADITAKNAAASPVLTTSNFDHIDLHNYIHSHYYQIDRNLIFNSSSNWYRAMNRDRKPILNVFPTNMNRSDTVKFTRLRLGQTKITHGHLLKLTMAPYCHCVSNTTDTHHFLADCPKFNTIRIQLFQNNDPILCLSNPTVINIQPYLNSSK